MTVEEKAALAANDVELLDAVAELERIVHKLPVLAPAYGVPVVGSMVTAPYW